MYVFIFKRPHLHDTTSYRECFPVVTTTPHMHDLNGYDIPSMSLAALILQTERGYVNEIYLDIIMGCVK